MICTLNGHPIEQRCLVARETVMGDVPVSVQRHLRLVLGRDEFVELLSSAYFDLSRELKEDIQAVGNADDDELACLAYPTLKELVISAPAALPGLMRDYLWNDLVRVCFDPHPSENSKYVVDAYKSMTLSSSDVTIDASAYHIRPFERQNSE